MMMSKIRYGVFLVLAATGLVIISCKKSTTQQSANNAVLNQAANTHFNFQILVSSYIGLASPLGYAYIPNQGIKGILVFNSPSSTPSNPIFYAYERACTYDGLSNANAKVWVQTGSFTCRDSVCGSVFTISDGSGQPSHAPATYALKQYKCSVDGTGNIITISN